MTSPRYAELPRALRQRMAQRRRWAVSATSAALADAGRQGVCCSGNIEVEVFSRHTFTDTINLCHCVLTEATNLAILKDAINYCRLIKEDVDHLLSYNLDTVEFVCLIITDIHMATLS